MARRRLRAWPGGTVLCPANQLPLAEGIGLAHDAGNLLGALRLYCDLLARPGVLREEHRHYADELQLLSQRSGTLVNRLLNPAATAPPYPEAAPCSVSVPAVIEQCRGLLGTIAHRAVHAVYEAGAESHVPVPREAIERILVNLTKNAAEASAQGGTITLRVSRLQEPEDLRRRKGAASRIVLSIEDQGRGMSSAAVKVLMEASEGQGTRAAVRAAAQPQQLDELGLTTVGGRVRGLGFRVVRELVGATGGELRLKSRSGCGTTVEIAWAVAGEAVAGEPAAGRMQDQDGERQAVPVSSVTEGMYGRVAC